MDELEKLLHKWRTLEPSRCTGFMVLGPGEQWWYYKEHGIVLYAVMSAIALREGWELRQNAKSNYVWATLSLVYNDKYYTRDSLNVEDLYSGVLALQVYIEALEENP